MAPDPWSSIGLIAARAMRNGAVKFVSMIRASCASVKSWKSPLSATPALLTSTSSLPKRSSAAVTIRAGASCPVTSAATQA